MIKWSSINYYRKNGKETKLYPIHRSLAFLMLSEIPAAYIRRNNNLFDFFLTILEVKGRNPLMTEEMTCSAVIRRLFVTTTRRLVGFLGSHLGSDHAYFLSLNQPANKRLLRAVRRIITPTVSVNGANHVTSSTSTQRHDGETMLRLNFARNSFFHYHSITFCIHECLALGDACSCKVGSTCSLIFILTCSFIFMLRDRISFYISNLLLDSGRRPSL